VGLYVLSDLLVDDTKCNYDASAMLLVQVLELYNTLCNARQRDASRKLQCLYNLPKHTMTFDASLVRSTIQPHSVARTSTGVCYLLLSYISRYYKGLISRHPSCSAMDNAVKYREIIREVIKNVSVSYYQATLYTLME